MTRKRRVSEEQNEVEITAEPEQQPEAPTLRYVEDVRQLITGRLVENPAYSSEHVELNGHSFSLVHDWHPSPKAREKEYVFYYNLRESVKAKGVKYPVCCFAFGGGVFIKTGISRLWAGVVENKPVPAIVVDHDHTLGETSAFPYLDQDEDFPALFKGVTYDDNVHPVLGWYYTSLSERVSMDDPRYLENPFG